MTDWKRKLAAYLHDPPSKFADIGLHEEHAARLFRQAGFLDEEENRRLSDAYAKSSDWTASSADRLPFPSSREVRSKFDGECAKFHHPLSPGVQFGFHKAFVTAEAAMEVDETVQPIASDIAGWSEEDQWRGRFFAHWRLWEKFCTDRDYRFGFLPADTRIPDHTIWTHMQVVSALDGCAEGTGGGAVLKPAFLKFQLGPVQDFIAEARSIRDLWSGSYLLSWLMATGLAALATEIGPDSVVFPSLKGQPLFDLHLRDKLWSQLKVNGKTVWEHLNYDTKPTDAESGWSPSYLTPNLPNVFLAVVPAERADELGRLVCSAIDKEWKKIAENCWKFCDDAGMFSEGGGEPSKGDRKTRFDSQVKRQFSLTFQATPWPSNLDAALALADQFGAEMPIQKAKGRVQAIVTYATKTMPEADRDGRYYKGGKDGPKARLNNIGLGWSVILAMNGWELDAARQTRAFDGWNTGGWTTGVTSNKDSLGGKAEAVAGGRTWQENAKRKGGLWASLFKHADWLGATTLIKRVWHVAHLKDEWRMPTDSNRFKMPNTRGIAEGKPTSSDEDDDVETLAGEKYFAVLALDGDEIGRWVSGEKTPPISAQVSDYPDGSGAQRQGALAYFQSHGGKERPEKEPKISFLETSRPLSPSFHLQFSQALSNFALHCAERVVRAFQGRLIYAGGDDVLAMLPADTAIACASALREAFQGRSVPIARITSSQPGFVSTGERDYEKREIAFIAPGPAVECSVGIAIAHFKSPLQDVVRAAQLAEKRAKRPPERGGFGRGAVAVTLMKRSGEIIEWGSKWESGGLELSSAITAELDRGHLSGKFPHRVVKLLEPYLLSKTGLKPMTKAPNFDSAQTIAVEFTHALGRQAEVSGEEKRTMVAELSEALGKYLNALGEAQRDTVPDVIGLCQTVAFSHRTRRGTQNEETQQ